MTYRRSPNTIGTFAARPTSAPDGTIYMCTDSPIQLIMSGGSWKPYLGSKALVAPPAANTWSLINATLNTNFSDFRGGLLFNGQCSAGTMHVAKRAAPATPYVITAHFLHSWGTNANSPGSHNFATAGLCWRNSSSGNIQVMGPTTATTASGIYVQTFRLCTASGSGSSGITYGNSTDLSITPILHNLSSHGVWLRIADNGTNRMGYYSGDGINWKFNCRYY